MCVRTIKENQSLLDGAILMLCVERPISLCAKRSENRRLSENVFSKSLIFAFSQIYKFDENVFGSSLSTYRLKQTDGTTIWAIRKKACLLVAFR